MGVHPAPLAIYRSVRRRATRDRMLWVRADVAEQPRRLLDAARGEGARAGGSRLFVVFTFFFLVGGGLCRSTQRGARARRERKYDRKSFSDMHERTWSPCARAVPPQNFSRWPRSSTPKSHRVPFFCFFSSTKCVADEQQVGKKYRPVARARARRRALYALEAARDDRRVPERRGFRQRDARRGDDSHIRHAKQILSRLRQQTGPRRR